MNKDDIFKVVNAAMGSQEVPAFIANFQTHTGLIYGIGPTIAEYFACIEVFVMVQKTKEEYLQRANAEAWLQLAMQLPELAWQAFNERLKVHRESGGAGIFARSNKFIQFSDQDQMKIKAPNQRYPNFGMVISQNDQGRTEFFQRFSQSGYSVASASRAKLGKGIEKDWSGHGANFTNRNNIVGQDLTSIRQFMVRRACKFLIYDQIENRDGKIHYALDGINIDEVVNKVARPLDAYRSKVPVCTSELREIFRMWSFLSSHVTFYNQLEKVKPPWKTDNQNHLQLWSAYALTRAEKALANQQANIFVSNTVGEVRRYHNEGRYRQAIKSYHSMPWAWLPRPALPFSLKYRF